MSIDEPIQSEPAVVVATPDSSPVENVEVMEATETSSPVESDNAVEPTSTPRPTNTPRPTDTPVPTPSEPVCQSPEEQVYLKNLNGRFVDGEDSTQLLWDNINDAITASFMGADLHTDFLDERNDRDYQAVKRSARNISSLAVPVRLEHVGVRADELAEIMELYANAMIQDFETFRDGGELPGIGEKDSEVTRKELKARITSMEQAVEATCGALPASWR